MGKGGNPGRGSVPKSSASKQDVNVAERLQKMEKIPPAHVLPPNCPWQIALTIRTREAIGWVLTINFLVFWAIPIAGNGLLWKHCLRHVIRPLFYVIDSRFSPVRWVASRYLYKNPRHGDYAATAFLVTLSAFASLSMVFWYQLTYGTLSWSVIAAYYWLWVGIGGRQMGGAYTFAHKEGHNAYLYQPWFKKTIGNWFENYLGVFYGNVPWNFTTSHISIHHKLQGGMGDTFYQWDIDRTSWRDFMLFIYRIMTHVVGFSSLYFFKKNEQHRAYNLLRQGMLWYWLVVPSCLYAITGSFSFIFFIYLQPAVAMMYFLAFINIGLHAYIDFDENGRHISVVNSSAVRIRMMMKMMMMMMMMYHVMMMTDCLF
uniref:Fatty acid desaturase domain-containing protein n=2 Tax=Bigelowiella natans TaxID=227086 RepID=A0A7S2KHB1_BIGNA|mmetsp:Transcript_1128/g.1747  ORF Transcript_1128/g.1747 Transcript_1128/m.1747 type:complete len:371 (+) Transcript_1128:92-1204(+)